MLVQDLVDDLGRSTASQIMKVSNQVHLVVVTDLVSDVEPTSAP